MTKHFLIPSTLLLVAGCATVSGDLGTDELNGVDVAVKGDVEFPDDETEGVGQIEEVVGSVLDFFSQSDVVEELVAMSYAMPNLPEMGVALNAPCAESPNLREHLMVLESAGSSALLHRWGWEVAVTDCEIGQETFSGVFRFSYEELAREPVLEDERPVWHIATDAVLSNASGHSSLRYELDVFSSDTRVYAVGSEFGPDAFLASDFRATLVDLDTGTTSELKSDIISRKSGLDSDLVGGSSGVDAQQFIYHRAPGKISLEDGDLSRVSIGTEGLISRPGDAWPHSGTIDGVIRGLGPIPVLVKFTESTPVDGTVEVETPTGWVSLTLSMD